tara:strand:- start:764 stop:877 length:114 start_codon:yes stop_codon:yes gene_type:complete
MTTQGAFSGYVRENIHENEQNSGAGEIRMKTAPYGNC